MASAETDRLKERTHKLALWGLLDHWDEDWGRLWWLRLDGTLQVLTPSEADGDRSEAERALRDKYRQYREVPLFVGTPTLLCFSTEATSSWCAGPEAAREVLG